MAKSRQKKRNKQHSEETQKKVIQQQQQLPDSNPLQTQQEDFLHHHVSSLERDHFFSNDDTIITSSRRADIWAAQCALGEQLVQDYAWATPDSRALRIMAQFSPLVEMGCGANAYWCRQLFTQKNIDIVAYDADPQMGGRIQKDDKKGSYDQSPESFRVQKGGPEVLSQHSDRTLFLCYPDEETSAAPVTANGENDQEQPRKSDGDDEDSSADTTTPTTSLAMTCLEHYQGDTIIHVGELLVGAPILNTDQAPWGRSSSPSFQERLATEFHCILRVTLPNWLHTSDCLTVWKRSQTTTFVFTGDDDDDDDDEHVAYRYIPPDEQLVVDCAAPCVKHLLLPRKQQDEPTIALTSEDTSSSPIKDSSPQKRKQKRKHAEQSSKEQEGDYECPW